MMARLGDVCAKITDGSHNPPQGISCSEYLMLSSKNIYDDDISFDDPRYLSKENYETENKRTQISAGDILLTIVGTVGRAAVVSKTEKKICLQRSVAVIKPKQELIDSRFLMYQLQSMRTHLEQEARGVAQKGIYLRQVENLQIKVPSRGEQLQVVSNLDQISELISLRKQQLAKLDELVKARFVELFGDKGHPEDTLLNLCNIIDYRGKTPEKVEHGLPFITAKNVRMHQMNLEPREYISKATYDKVMVRGFPKEGDVVFTTEAPLGNVCRIPHFDTEFYIGQRIVTMQTEKLEPIYLEYALSSDDFKMKYMGKSSGSTVTGIRVRLLEQLTIPVPPIDIQTQFATFVKQTDKSKLVIQESLAEL